jgi:hypothetical protein
MVRFLWSEHHGILLSFQNDELSQGLFISFKISFSNSLIETPAFLVSLVHRKNRCSYVHKTVYPHGLSRFCEQNRTRLKMDFPSHSTTFRWIFQNDSEVHPFPTATSIQSVSSRRCPLIDFQSSVSHPSSVSSHERYYTIYLPRNRSMAGIYQTFTA